MATKKADSARLDRAMKIEAMRNLAPNEPVQPVSLSDAEFQKVKRLTLESSDSMQEAFVFIGSYLTRLAGLEQELLLFVSNLSDSEDPRARARKDWKTTASGRRKKLSQLLPPEWHEGQALIALLECLNDKRNQFAHNPVIPFWVDDGQIVEGPVLRIERLEPSGWVTEYMDMREDARVVLLALYTIVDRALYVLWGLLVEHEDAFPRQLIARGQFLGDAIRLLDLEPPLSDLQSELLVAFFPSA